MDRRTDTLTPGERDQLEQLIAQHLGTTFPAMQLVVSQGGDMVLDAWYAMSHPYPDHPTLTAASLFDLASLTKLFTASAFLALVSANAVKLDDPVSAVIPEFLTESPCRYGYGQDPHTEEPIAFAPNLIGKPSQPELVDFRHLLTHASGLAPWKNLFRLFDFDDSRSPTERYYAAVFEICRAPLVDSIESNVHYSDLGFILLGEAVSRLTGKPLDIAIADLVTSPLGLESMTFNPLQHGNDLSHIAPTEYDQRWRHKRCHGFVHDENADSFGGISGHAGLFGTAADVHRFGLAWLNESPELGISSDVMEEATSAVFAINSFRRGLGWMLKSTTDSLFGDAVSSNSYGHTGFTGTSLLVDPERELVVSCLTNRVYYGREREGIGDFRRDLHSLFIDAADSARS